MPRPGCFSLPYGVPAGRQRLGPVAFWGCPKHRALPQQRPEGDSIHGVRTDPWLERKAPGQSWLKVFFFFIAPLRSREMRSVTGV